MSPQSSTEAPIAFIVDDAPVNAAYLARAQMEERGMASPSRGSFAEWLSRWREMAGSEIVPNDFWERFIAWAQDAGVKGKFTFLPCPGGFGRVDKHVEGYSDAELEHLLCLIRDEYTKCFDITPEIFTHTLAWDIEKEELLPITEWQWTYDKSEDDLADYMARALQTLQNVGIPATGVTQPCNFRGDEDLFAMAVLRSIKQVTGASRTFYFLHAYGDRPAVPSPLMIADSDADEYVLSVVSGSRADEPFWDTIYGGGDVDEMSDYFISRDGTTGRLVELAASGEPVVFHGHAQTLFSNGTEKGFQSLQEVVRRVNEHLLDRVEWMTMSELVDWAVAREEATQ